MPATWKLIIEDDAGKQIVVPFTRDIITIGRKEGNTIRLTERNVSRNHAKLSKENSHVVLEDLKSFNGIKLNGDRIDGRVLVHEGDTIQIGDYHLALHAQDGAGTLPQGSGPGGVNANTADMRRGSADALLPDGGDDDEFAGDTQRWEPPPGQPSLQVGGLDTVQDRAAVSDEHTAPAPIVTVRTAEGGSPAQGGFGADGGDTERVTMDMLAPLSAGRPSSIPNRPSPGRDVELEPTVRQPASPAAVSMPSSPPSQPVPAASLPSSNAASSAATTRTASAPHAPVPSAQPSEFFGETRPEPRLGDRAVDVTPPHAMKVPAPGSHAPAQHAQASPRMATGEARGALEEQTEAMKASPGASGADELAVPRLVVLNTIFSGSTFTLRAAEAVIGRTEDNDITIEHKSVSRNHAKIVREGDRVRILDLKSANGVLVNNEEVEQAVLRSGDVVELGRVRLRFVAIGERFAVAPDEIERARIADAAGDDFENDAGTGVTNPVRKKQSAFAAPSASYPIVEQSGRPAWVYVAIGGVVILAGIAFLLLKLGGSSNEEKKSDATPANNNAATPNAVVARADPGPPPPGPSTVPVPPVPPPPPVATDEAKADDPSKVAAADPPAPPTPAPPDDTKVDESTHKSSSSSSSSSSSHKSHSPSLSEALATARAASFHNDSEKVNEALASFATGNDAEVHKLLCMANAKLKRSKTATYHYGRFVALKPSDTGTEEMLRKVLTENNIK